MTEYIKYPKLIKKQNGMFCYDPKTSEDEEYYKASSYYDGFATVAKTKKSGYQFRDLEGNLSEEFYDVIRGYDNGFAKVQKTKRDPVYYRDMMGRLLEHRDRMGSDFCEFYNSRLDYEDLDIKYFANQKFCSAVLGVLKRNFIAEQSQKCLDGKEFDTEEEKAKAKQLLSELEYKKSHVEELVNQKKAELEEIRQKEKRQKEQLAKIVEDADEIFGR